MNSTPCDHKLVEKCILLIIAQIIYMLCLTIDLVNGISIVFNISIPTVQSYVGETKFWYLRERGKLIEIFKTSV